MGQYIQSIKLLARKKLKKIQKHECIFTTLPTSFSKDLAIRKVKNCDLIYDDEAIKSPK